MSAPVWRVRTRREFAELRRAGRTVRRGPVAVRFTPEPSATGGSPPPRIAYAIGRPVGNAVVRNRLRRQLRHIVADLSSAHRIPQGMSLIMVQPEAIDLGAAELRSRLEALFAELRASGEHRAS